MRNIFIVLAGGVGERMGATVPKQFLKIAGKPIIQHTLENISQIESIDQILIVMHKSSIAETQNILSEIKTTTPIKIIQGGDTRTQSTLNALQFISDKEAFVLLHDAVRPFIDKKIVDRCLLALQDFEAVDTAIVSADTIVGVDENDCINSMPIRHFMRRGQTPQCFKLSTLRQAYKFAKKDNNFQVTDNCGVVFKYLPDVEIKVIQGSEENIKITENIDLQFADKIFQMKTAPITDLHIAKEIFLDKKVLVLGGSYGIGKACVDLFSKLGAKVISASRSQTQTDITNPDSINHILDSANQQLGGIDLVILTAGQLSISKLIKMSDDDIRSLINIDLIAPAIVAKLAYPYLKQSSGELIFFTSSSYTRGRSDYSIYSAAKAGVVNLTQALSEEWADDNIRVNCINPQRTDTPMRTQAFGKEPSQTLLNPEIVAEFTAKTTMANITGQIVDVRLN